MKREEMVKSIENFIRYWGGHPDKEAVANALLETIEQKGMVPPMIKEKSFQMLENGEMTYAVHEWEK